jgi:hypothetical protein
MLALALPFPAVAAGIQATLYKSPSCGCCQHYAEYLEENGFQVKVVPTPELAQLQKQNGVPQQLAGCHTTKIGDYVFEGHIPADSIKRFLKEKPVAKGLTVPGMPQGSPGMSGTKQGPLQVYTISNTGEPKLYDTH